MKTTTAQRTAALAAWLTACDMRDSGISLADALRTPESLRVKDTEAKGQILHAYIDNNVGHVPFAVLTLDESRTTMLIPDRVSEGLPDYGDDDCVTLDGVTFLVVCLG